LFRGESHDSIDLYWWGRRLIWNVFAGRHRWEFPTPMDLPARAPARRRTVVTNPNLFRSLAGYLTRGQLLWRLVDPFRIFVLVHVPFRDAA